MPALPGWYGRIPDILESLGSEIPILDRLAFERLFGVSRRQAIRLMAATGGYQVGKTFLVERHVLVRFLEDVLQTPAARHARHRKQRILGLLRQNVVVPVQMAAPLTPGVSKVSSGIVEIRYNGTEDLLSKIVALVTAAAEDYHRFRDQFE